MELNNDPFLKSLSLVLIIIPIIATSLIVAFATYLYNIKKTQFRLQTKILFMISFFWYNIISFIWFGYQFTKSMDYFCFFIVVFF
ncbi:hypothetical protein BHE82_00170 [Rice orange leaf phytoplasma]|nr:hypothetical protein BHE82_00170 [Rice orange leaf phytoplasma]